MGIHPLELIPGVKIVFPEERGAIERMGGYNRYAEPGFHFVIPFMEQIRTVNISEQMKNVEPSDMITNENMNAKVDLEVYFKPLISRDNSEKENEKNLKKVLYDVDDYEQQVTSLAVTTARNVIGTKNFEAVNSKRQDLNKKLKQELDDQTDSWGIDVVRVELEEIEPPRDVQKAMNDRMEAENEKEAAKDRAEAREIEADGEKRAEIKKAEGQKQAEIEKAQGEAQAIEEVANAEAEKIEIVNTSLQDYFVGSAQTYKQLETVQGSLQDGSKYILDSESDPTLVVSEMMDGVTPIDPRSDDEEDEQGHDIGDKIEEAAQKAAGSEE